MHTHIKICNAKTFNYKAFKSVLYKIQIETFMITSKAAFYGVFMAVAVATACHARAAAATGRGLRLKPTAMSAVGQAAAALP